MSSRAAFVASLPRCHALFVPKCFPDAHYAIPRKRKQVQIHECSEFDTGTRIVTSHRHQMNCPSRACFERKVRAGISKNIAFR
jgi:hypothetical protein